MSARRGSQTIERLPSARGPIPCAPETSQQLCLLPSPRPSAGRVPLRPEFLRLDSRHRKVLIWCCCEQRADVIRAKLRSPICMVHYETIGHHRACAIAQKLRRSRRLHRQPPTERRLAGTASLAAPCRWRPNSSRSRQLARDSVSRICFLQRARSDEKTPLHTSPARSGRYRDGDPQGILGPARAAREVLPVRAQTGRQIRASRRPLI